MYEKANMVTVDVEDSTRFCPFGFVVCGGYCKKSF